MNGLAIKTLALKKKSFSFPKVSASSKEQSPHGHIIAKLVNYKSFLS